MSQSEDKVICPACNAENLPGMLFCVECGTYLPSGGPLRTEPLPDDEEDQPAHPRPTDEVAAKERPALSIDIQVLKSSRKVTFSADQEILIGRLDAAHGICPQLDLSEEGGLEQSVSRRHARIYTRDGMCFVEDLDSTNGTFLNGERLIPYLPYAFRDGDAITLGSMELKVKVHTAA